MQDRDHLEAQFWWAFSCLAVAGCRDERDFREEVVRRHNGLYPGASEVDSIVKDACCHLAPVLNHAKSGRTTTRRELSGWERHLALFTPPQ